MYFYFDALMYFRSGVDSLDLPRPITPVRGEPIRWPMNDFEYYAMRGVMNGRDEGKPEPIMDGKIRNPKYNPANGWKKMEQIFRTTKPPIVIHYFENTRTGQREEFHFQSKPAFYDPRYW
jgi:hypothetical protein